MKTIHDYVNINNKFCHAKTMQETKIDSNMIGVIDINELLIYTKNLEHFKNIFTEVKIQINDDSVNIEKQNSYTIWEPINKNQQKLNNIFCNDSHSKYIDHSLLKEEKYLGLYFQFNYEVVKEMFFFYEDFIKNYIDKYDFVVEPTFYFWIWADEDKEEWSDLVVKSYTFLFKTEQNLNDFLKYDLLLYKLSVD